MIGYGGINMEFKNSITKDNLMRAFAGESQARNRYTFAAAQAKKADLPVIAEVFTYTANQEKEHAEIFYNYLKELAGENICVDGCYPVDFSENVADLLTAAKHNEYEEYQDVYKNFAEKAKEEGFLKVAASFEMIAQIEKVHGDRFDYYLTLMKEGKLLKSDKKEIWVCQNCGYIHEGDSVPPICPSCRQENGYFMRAEHTPYGIGKAR